MPTGRLEVRLDNERRRKLKDLAADQRTPVSNVIRALIDKAYEESLLVRRKRAAYELGQLKIEDVPSPSILSQELENAHEPGGIC